MLAGGKLLIPPCLPRQQQVRYTPMNYARVQSVTSVTARPIQRYTLIGNNVGRWRVFLKDLILEQDRNYNCENICLPNKYCLFSRDCWNKHSTHLKTKSFRMMGFSSRYFAVDVYLKVFVQATPDLFGFNFQ